MIGGLIVIGILVAIVVWLLANVVLPLALLNSALIFTILALTVKGRKPVFASLALAGAGYMLFDISNGWLSANFVNHVVKTPDWLTAFVYINAAAVGASAWMLVQPLFQKAVSVRPSNKRNDVLLSIAAAALVGVPMVLVPVIHHVVGTPFSNRTIATPMSSTPPAGPNGATPPSAITTPEISGPSAVSPAPPAAALFIGKWQLVEGELHPVTKELVKSFLTIAGTPDTPTVVWTSELDGSVDHTINLKYTGGSLTGDYYGSKGNVAIEMLSDGRLSFTIDPYAEFAPIKNSIYARVLDTTNSKESRTVVAREAGETRSNVNAVAQDLIGVWRDHDGNCLDIGSIGASGDLHADFRRCAAGAVFVSVGLHLVGASLRYNGDDREQLVVMPDGSLQGALESIPLRERVGASGQLRFYKDSTPSKEAQ